MKISLDGINGRLDTAEEVISELEDIAMDFIKMKQREESNRGKKKRNRPPTYLWYNIRWSNVEFFEQKRQGRYRRIFEEMATYTNGFTPSPGLL